MRVLICDDAGFIRELIKSALSTLHIFGGFEVVGEAASGPEALALASELEPDLIFMDLVLPGMNGLQTATEILSEFNQIKIIAMSSLDQKWIVRKALLAGCASFLPKPFERETIADCLFATFPEWNERERKKAHG
jgi:YesN/AraC family two-component response regulator